MKKITAVLSAAALGIGIAAPAGPVPAAVWAQAEAITVTVDGTPVLFPDQEPVMIADRVLVPARGVFEAMGAEVTYVPPGDNAGEQVFIQYGSTAISFEIGSSRVAVGKGDVVRTKTLDVSTQMLRDRAMIPIRFVSETIGYRVDWNAAQNRVEITAPESEPPENPAEIQLENRVSLGKNNGALIKDDGTVWVWGDGSWGQLGGLEKSEEPVEVKGISGAVAVACGSRSVYVLKGDGTVWSWGYNGSGELGRESAAQTDTEPGIIPGLSGVQQLSAGSNFVLALDDKGKVWSWGSNRNGQLGLGDTENRGVPEPIEAIDKRVISISAGSDHGAAVAQDQMVWLWGSNSAGQLGRSKSVLRAETPFELKTISRLTKAAAGGNQTIALRPDGSVYMWGTTYVGQPPEGTPEENNLADAEGFYRYAEPQRMRYVYYDQEREEDMLKILTGASMISCGDSHSVALAGGRIYAWGDSALMAYRIKDQIWRLYAQEYAGLDHVAAVYAAKERDIYALDENGDLWLIDGNGKKKLVNVRV